MFGVNLYEEECEGEEEEETYPPGAYDRMNNPLTHITLDKPLAIKIILSDIKNTNQMLLDEGKTIFPDSIYNYLKQLLNISRQRATNIERKINTLSNNEMNYKIGDLHSTISIVRTLIIVAKE